ncbi:MAG: Nif11-like leader peptide family RiPP precursor [Xenococcaceae cyanobacterium]
MSIESAKAFYSRLTTDKVLRKKLENANSNEKFLAIVAEAGYSFTRKEWESVLNNVSSVHGSQLSSLTPTVIETISWGLWGLSPDFSDRESSSNHSLGKIKRSLTKKLKYLQPQSLKRVFQFSSWPIKTKFLVVLLSLALVPMSLSIYYNSFGNFKNLENQEIRQLKLLATSYANHLDRLIFDIKQVTIQLSSDSNLIDFLSSSDANKQKVLSPPIQKRLENILRSSPDYDAVYALDLNGRCFAANDRSLIDRNHASMEYFQQAAQGNFYISSITIDATSKRPTVYFSDPIKNQTNAIVGVVVVQLKGQTIEEAISAIKLEDSKSYAFLVDREGIIIDFSDRSRSDKSLVSLPPKTLLGNGHDSYYSSKDREERTVGFASLKMLPWTLAISQPKTRSTVSIFSLFWENILALSLVAAIATVLALILSKNIVKPIHSLTKAARELEQDIFQPQDLVKVSCFRDDIGKLVRVFLHMAQQIKAREENLRQRESMQIEVDEAKKERQVAEVTRTEYFQELQKKAQKLKSRAENNSNPNMDYMERLQEQAQKLKKVPNLTIINGKKSR